MWRDTRASRFAKSPDRATLVGLREASGSAGSIYSDNNWEAGAPLREWHGVRTDAEGRVVELDLAIDGLRGVLPAVIGKQTSLEEPVLRGNRQKGPVPPGMGSLGAPTVMDIGINELSGPRSAADRKPLPPGGAPPR